MNLHLAQLSTDLLLEPGYFPLSMMSLLQYLLAIERPIMPPCSCTCIKSSTINKQVKNILSKHPESEQDYIKHLHLNYIWDPILLLFSYFLPLPYYRPLLVGPESHFLPQMKKSVKCCPFKSHNDSEFIA